LKRDIREVAKAFNALPADLEKQLWVFDDAAAVVRPVEAATGRGSRRAGVGRALARALHGRPL
jgi:hypothetical protein